MCGLQVPPFEGAAALGKHDWTIRGWHRFIARLSLRLHRSGHFDRESLQRAKKSLQRGTMSRRPASAGVSSKTYGAYGEMERWSQHLVAIFVYSSALKTRLKWRAVVRLWYPQTSTSVASISESEKKKPHAKRGEQLRPEAKSEKQDC